MTLPAVRHWEEVPEFSELEQEREFWRAHQVAPALMQEACWQGQAAESTTITLRMDPRMLARLKRLAAQRYLNYQSMLKQWVAERLEKEMEGKG